MAIFYYDIIYEILNHECTVSIEIGEIHFPQSRVRHRKTQLMGHERPRFNISGIYYVFMYNLIRSALYK